VKTPPILNTSPWDRASSTKRDYESSLSKTEFTVEKNSLQNSEPDPRNDP